MSVSAIVDSQLAVWQRQSHPVEEGGANLLNGEKYSGPGTRGSVRNFSNLAFNGFKWRKRLLTASSFFFSAPRLLVVIIRQSLNLNWATDSRL